MQWIPVDKVQMQITTELKRNWLKVNDFWNAGAVGIYMVELKKPGCTNIFVHGGTLLKSLSVTGYSEKKTSFWESVNFHCKKFGLTIFGLFLHIRIVSSMIFIKTNW